MFQRIVAGKYQPKASSGFKRLIKFISLLLIAVSFLSAPAYAAKYAGIVIDVNSGKILYSSSAESRRYPASLTKMMTLYLLFEAMDQGRVSKNSRIPMSRHAASEPPTKLGVKAGRTVRVEDAILALVTRSANDVSTAIAEYLGGSEAKFARMMTAKAHALGMKNTVYFNAHGLPDNRQVTTAKDQAILSIALRQHFPQYYGYFSTRSFRFGKQKIGNHNRLLGRVRGVDGIKTGYTRAAGFNLATSAKADGRSIVVVVLGMPTGRERNAKVTALVQRYLPRGSTRKSGMVIAKVTTPSGKLRLPEEVPIPTARYEDNAAPASPATLAFAAEKPAMPKSPSDSVPTPRPAPVSDEVRAEAGVDVDKLTTGSTKKDLPSGWVVQVGAAETRRDAQLLLQKVQDRGGKVLRSASAFTVAYNDNGNEVFRARFGGFQNQAQAVNTCKQLKKKGIGCWASLQ